MPNIQARSHEYRDDRSCGLGAGSDQEHVGFPEMAKNNLRPDPFSFQASDDALIWRRKTC
jgi:hypothetical protein